MKAFCKKGSLAYRLLIVLIILFTLSSNLVFAQGKPELSEKDLADYTKYFEIKNGEFVGDGSSFLLSEFAKHQYILMGEYHGSHQLSLFTQAIIPPLHKNGFRYFGLEIGPVSSQILTEMMADTGKISKKLNQLNSRYLKKAENRYFTPIPFFSYVEDAEFLKEAAIAKWQLIGLDQEFMTGYTMLLDRMYQNLNDDAKKLLKDSHLKAVEAVRIADSIDAAKGTRMYETINSSSHFNDFLTEASKNNKMNQEIAEALRITNSIYLKSVQRKYYEQNSDRVTYMKQNLGNFLNSESFDLSKDKMLLKMGAVHTGRGFSPLSLFEIGNTLSELAEFNGNSSLHINFNSRFYMDGDKEIDDLADSTSYGYRFKGLFQMAKKDQWTVIDLRPLRSKVFYNRAFKLDEIILEIFKNYDWFIMPPLDTDAAPNYNSLK
ncbi:MAG: hypothetical protein IPN54_15420 [Bacteroidetes bacterium]|nr:hypothetical protein [Bacteroidota bacterium]